MNRRRFLAGACGGLIATSGCLGLGRSTPFVTDRGVDALDRGCGDKQNEISPRYDESADQLHLEGVLSGTTACGPLDITYAYNQESDRVIVEVILLNDNECESCTRYYEYDATVSFRKTPDIVAVAHSAPEDVMEMRALVIEEETTTAPA
ncbi:membrane lipoprotein [Halorhabdus tiamatea SARL4B]|jgi:hypothetical protein|uniref:Membrane lipoprotein n=1 Tax=Halorhabdus tiamatea SARL4B TaxID=1033806 RepID=U2DEV3_9EURY|nr:membrane lipoprotein [Halorhabdus tiamatea SARL4B]